MPFFVIVHAKIKEHFCNVNRRKQTTHVSDTSEKTESFVRSAFAERIVGRVNHFNHDWHQSSTVLGNYRLRWSYRRLRRGYPTNQRSRISNCRLEWIIRREWKPIRWRRRCLCDQNRRRWRRNLGKSVRSWIRRIWPRRCTNPRWELCHRRVREVNPPRRVRCLSLKD